MKSQKHNQADLKELKVKIEKDVVESLENMASNSGIPIEDLVVIALKRFRASHGDYTGRTPKLD
jgi:fructose-1,6-bisphosphatase/sedoheptulose 1,7-bisphosphatase-like protein